MEVTKENFGAVLPEVLAGIAECSFIAVDTEFTGLLDGVRESWADIHEDRYQKLRQGSSRFLLMQFGLCLFTPSPPPSPSLHSPPSLPSLPATPNPPTYVATPYNFYLFPTSSYKQLDKRFLCQASSLSLLAAHNMDFNKWIKGGIPYLSEDEERWWRERRGGEEEEVSQGELNLFLGFSQVFKTIASSGKPVVAHNCSLDLLHLYSHFIGPLPERLAEFKSEIHKRLPHIYDTKLIAAQDIFESCFQKHSLGDIYSMAQREPFPPVTVSLPSSLSHYQSSSVAHEAAYDAFITGYSLIAMATYLQQKADRGGESTDSTSVDLMTAISPHKNRLFLGHCNGTNSMELCGPDSPLPRDHVFQMTVVEDMTTDDIKNLFSPFGGCWVSWLGPTSCHVVMTRRHKAKEAFQRLASRGSQSDKPFTLTPYASPYHPPTPHDEEGRGGGGQKRPRQTTEDEASDNKKAALFEVSQDWS